MSTNWVPAYGEHQLPFMGVANRALLGELCPCPKCSSGLRAYFHVFQPQTGKGSLWVWCGTCGMYTTLPRVQPTVGFPDPFSDVPRGEFGALETNSEDRFFDRLERMWRDGILHPPRSFHEKS